MHGGDIYRHRVDFDFSVNINPLGIPETVRDALAGAVEKADHYPDPAAEELTCKLAARYQVSAERIVCGNGASELIMAMMQAFRPEKLMLSDPCFSGYERACQPIRTKILHLPLPEENGFRPTSFCLSRIRSEKPDMIFFTNPENPSGTMIPQNLLRKAAKTISAYGGVTVVDECFLELTDRFEESMVLADSAASPGLFVLNALTKTYAIPGVRTGFLICPSKEEADRIRRILPEWNLSVFAQMAGTAAMETPPDYLENARMLIREQRSFLTGRLRGMGLKVCESEACYLLFCADPELHLYERLLKKRILIRDCSDYRGLGPGWYRIAVRRKEENERLLEQIETILKETNSQKIPEETAGEIQFRNERLEKIISTKEKYRKK